MPHLSATIDRFEGEQAVLIFSDGQQLIISRADLPGSAAEGQVIYLHLTLDQAQTAIQDNLAKSLLKEILRKEDG